uniref:Genome polyprotein n=1 Tax=Tiger flathead picornavirus FL8 TaxID=2813204 RepID=A0A894JHK5_9PICO|nr:MAG: RNA-dependent RNA polymerase [Tiger flathead picornavirus FL8]
MELLKNINKTVGSLLQDPLTEEREMTSDRETATRSANAFTIDQASVRPRTVFDPSLTNQDDFHSMCFGHQSHVLNPEKLVALSQKTWSVDDPVWRSLIKVDLPKQFFVDKFMPAFGQSRYFKYVRTGFTFKLQVNAAAGVSGALMMVYTPADAVKNKSSYENSTFFLLPNAVLNLATTSTATLTIPYVNKNNYAGVDSTDLGTLEVMVLSKVYIPSTATIVDVTLFGMLDELDLQNVRPQAAPRQVVDIAQGPGSMNLANGKTLSKAQTFALQGEAVAVDPGTAGCSKPVQDFKDILRVPVPVDDGFFDWASSTAVGGTVYKATLYLSDLNPVFKMFTNGFKLWRGSVNLTLTVFATPFNKGRLRIVWYPNHKVESGGTLLAKHANNSINATVDIGLDSSFTMCLPYAYYNRLRDTAKVESEPLGRLEIMVLNRLTVNINTPPKVGCMLSVAAGEDFQMIAPVTRGIKYQAPDLNSQEKGSDVGLGALENVGGDPSGEEQRAPQGEVSGAPPHPGLSTINTQVLEVSIAKANHLKVSSVLSRAQYIGYYSMKSTEFRQIAIPVPDQGYMALLKLFTFFSGEFELHVYNDSEGPLSLAHAYDWKPSVPSVTVNSAAGCVIVPPRTNMTMRVPFYSGVPLRALHNVEDPLGYAMFDTPDAGGYVHLWISFNERSNFFFPNPVPKRATARSVLTSRFPHYHACQKDTMRKVDEAVLRATKGTYTPTGSPQTDDDDVDPEDGYVLTVDTEFVFNPNAESLDEYLFPEAAELVMDNPIGDRYPMIKDFSGLAIANQWVPELTECGDVESNPGPVQLCHIDRGLYKHYGVTDGVEVLHLSTENILSASMSGEAVVMKSPLDDTWVVEPALYTQVLPHLISVWQNTTHRFMADYDCESFAHRMLGLEGFTQTQSLAIFGAILACLSFGVAQGMPDAIRNVAGNIGDFAGKAKGFMSSMFSNRVFDAIKSEVVKTVAKTICRIVCYAILFCSNPNLLTGGAVAALIALDLTSVGKISKSTQALTESLINGDLMEIAESFIEIVAEECGDDQELIRESLDQTRLILKPKFPRRETKPQGIFKDFNETTQAAKGTEWWVLKLLGFIEWLKDTFFPSGYVKAQNWVKKNEDSIIRVMDQIDTLIMDAQHKGASGKPDFIKRRAAIRHKASQMLVVMRRATAYQLAGQMQNLVSKLDQVQSHDKDEADPFRVEPVCVYIASAPRQGKSFLVRQLCKRIMNADPDIPNKSVYFNPVGSKYMDGYAKQAIHVYDDFGQSRDEAEVGTFCQVVSSLPYHTPKANLEDKGMLYSSNYVLITSNRDDFKSFVSVTSDEALASRMHFKLKVRARGAYLSTSGKFMPAKAETTGALGTGECWDTCDMNGTWRPLDVDTLIAQIVQAMKEKRRISDRELKEFMKQGKIDIEGPEEVKYEADFDEVMVELEAIDSPFQCMKDQEDTYKPCPERVEGIRKWYKSLKDGVFKFWAVMCKWAPLITLVGGIANVAAMGIWFALKSNEPTSSVIPPFQKDMQGAYNGGMPLAAKDRVPLTEFRTQMRPEEIGYISTYSGYFLVPGFRTPIMFLGLKDKTLLTFVHCTDWIQSEGLQMMYNGMACSPKILSMRQVVSDEFKYDIMVVEVEAPYRFKDCLKHVGKPVSSSTATLIGRVPTGSFTIPCESIVPVDSYSVGGISVGLECFGAGVRYFCHNFNGLCGSLLVQKQGGKNVIVGMHTAGDGVRVGFAAQFHMILKDLVKQGIIVKKEDSVLRSHQPNKTKHKESPLHGAWDVEYGPTPLSPRDPRITTSVDSLVVKATEKYCSNVYEVDEETMDEAEDRVRSVLFSTVGACSTVSIEDAVQGIEGCDGIDCSTSPGKKYRDQGLTKDDLFPLVGDTRVPSQKIRDDVRELEIRLISGSRLPVTFTTVIKDDVVKKSKIETGDVRIIESCDVDYAVLYRMIMLEIHAKIHLAPAVLLPIAVGINPLNEFHSLRTVFKGELYAVDYSKFDGHLCKPLMELAVDILADLHDKPQLVHHLFKPIITSKHLVLDQIYTVEGGMPSGAPCTSILNSLCNWLMCEYVNVKLNGIESDSLFISTYGDDVLMSTKGSMEGAVEILKDSFGMVATSANKKSVILKTTWKDATYLKRYFRQFPGTTFTVGCLDIESIRQKIMWCRSYQSFVDQLKDALEEVALWGEISYNSFCEDIAPRVKEYQLHVPPYRVVRARLQVRLFA